MSAKVCLGAAVAVIAVLLAASAASAEAREPLQETASALQNAGTAMMAWWTDNTRGDMPSEDPRSIPDTIDWSECPDISYEELRTFLTPRYISDLPKKDGWGHSLQFCFRKDDLAASRLIVGVRSPGMDGEFVGSVYTPGEFPSSVSEYDLVWLDGHPIRWPETAR